MSVEAKYISHIGTTSFGADIRQESVLSSVLGNEMKESVGKYTRKDSRTNMSYSLEHRYSRQSLTASVGVLLNTNTAYTGKINLYPAVSF